MTPQEIANKWQMNRYRTPGQEGGMDNKEFYELMQDDISQYGKDHALHFLKWMMQHYLRGDFDGVVTYSPPYVQDPKTIEGAYAQFVEYQATGNDIHS